MAKRTYLDTDATISALASGSGGSVSIIRISGPKSLRCLAHLTQKNLVDLLSKKTRTFYLDTFWSKGSSPIDRGLFVFFQGPKSFTGEDLVELHVHSSPSIINRMFKTLFELEISPALAGEFSFRAVKNGKLSLFEAQATCDLIESSNKEANVLALKKLLGGMTDLLDKLGDSIRNLVTDSEVSIDFSDQDVPEFALDTLKQRAKIILNTITALEQSYSRGRRIQKGYVISLVGLPNSGKSSLFNALLGVSRAIVSKIPGTTRDLLGESLCLKASNGAELTICLEDTAGLRKTKNQIELAGISKTYESIKRADLVFFLLDPKGTMLANEREWSNLTKINQDLKTKTIGVLTKEDKIQTLSKSDQMNFDKKLKKFGISSWIQTSAVNLTGLQSLSDTAINLLSSRFNQMHDKNDELILTRQEQLEAVVEAKIHLSRSLSTPTSDLFAADLRHTLKALGPLIGETPDENILERIFSKFCIGK